MKKGLGMIEILITLIVIIAIYFTCFHSKYGRSNPFADNEKIKTQQELVDDKIKDIRNILSTRRRVNFLELFTEITKETIVVTFLSILEMTKSNEILLTQEDNFSPIMIERVSLWIY